MNGDLTIYIVDDSPLVRARLIESLADIPNARVVGEAGALDEALEGVRAIRPRVLILDVQLRTGSGLLLLKRMRAARAFRPETVIIVTNYPTEAYRQASEECGADHFFDKTSEFDRVREILIQLNSAA
jgi:DNA-binding NarL/FixJ family response regulator